jgi:hypothetical protein
MGGRWPDRDSPSDFFKFWRSSCSPVAPDLFPWFFDARRVVSLVVLIAAVVLFLEEAGAEGCVCRPWSMGEEEYRILCH